MVEPTKRPDGSTEGVKAKKKPKHKKKLKQESQRQISNFDNGAVIAPFR